MKTTEEISNWFKSNNIKCLTILLLDGDYVVMAQKNNKLIDGTAISLEEAFEIVKLKAESFWGI